MAVKKPAPPPPPPPTKKTIAIVLELRAVQVPVDVNAVTVGNLAKVPEVGKVTLVDPVRVRVPEKAPTVASVPPSAIDNVADVAGAVIVTLLIDVAVAAPILGVVRDGLIERTTEPEPVLVVTPVPPEPTESVPPRVTAPVVGTDGVRPVAPALNEETVLGAVAIAYWAILDTVVCTDVPDWTASRASVPLRAIATGRLGIWTLLTIETPS